ncbi:MFS transporter [Actinopolyspora mortivallis]|uniref:MFS transporter n=1 Tax=Actinopolyspora mortivallis TaxID=33906 RepID=UPI0003757059|nr:MFS transporter [Actinopolyspora mortivallis]
MTTKGTSATADTAVETRQHVGLKGWLTVLSVTVGIFSMVTAEQLPVGLLTAVSGSLHVTEGTAGLMVTLPGLVAAISAPVIPVAVGRLDRRILLIALMIIMGGSSLLSTLAPNFAVMLLGRVLVGITIGGFWAVAGSLAVRLVPEKYVPRATALIFGGVAAANVFGVPLGTLIGELAGWRTAFAALGTLALIVLVGLVSLLPKLPASEPVRLSKLAEQFRNHAVTAGVIATFLLVTGHFAAYTFVSPVLQSLSGVSVGLISSLLLGYGLAGIVTNFVAGSSSGRNVRGTVLTISLALAAVLALFPLLGGTVASGIVLLIMWGLAFGGVSVSLQTWMIKAAPHETEAASALWVSMFNLSISLGALFGGVVVDTTSLSNVLWLGAVLVLLTTLTVWSTRNSGMDQPAQAH